MSTQGDGRHETDGAPGTEKQGSWGGQDELMPLRWGLRRAPEPAQWPLSPRVLHPGMPSLLPCLAWGRGQASRKLAGCSPHSLHSPQPVQNDRLVSHTLVPAGSPSTRMSLSVVRFPHEGPLGGLGNCWAAQGSRVPLLPGSTPLYFQCVTAPSLLSRGILRD